MEDMSRLDDEEQYEWNRRWIGKPDYTVRRYKRQIRAGIAGKE